MFRTRLCVTTNSSCNIRSWSGLTRSLARPQFDSGQISIEIRPPVDAALALQSRWILVGLGSKSNANTVKIQHNYGQNLVRLRLKFDIITIKIWHDCGQNLTQLWWKSNAIAVEIWHNYAQNLMRLRSKFDAIVARIQHVCGRNSTGIRSLPGDTERGGRSRERRGGHTNDGAAARAAVSGWCARVAHKASHIYIYIYIKARAQCTHCARTVHCIP